MIKFVKQLSRESVVELIGVVSHPKKPLTGTTQQVDSFFSLIDSNSDINQKTLTHR